MSDLKIFPQGSSRAHESVVPRILIVMPAFNESESVGHVIREARSAVPEAGILVVDDGSCDATGVTARAAGAEVLVLPFNVGVGGAMRAGFLYAVRNGWDVVVQVDGDGQHDPAYVRDLVALVEQGVDIAIGARFAGVDGYLVRGPRRWAMRLLATAVSARCDTKLTDATSGMRAVGPRALSLFATEYPAEYLGDTVESLIIARRARLTMQQVPVRMRVRTQGQPSQGTIKATVYLLRAVLVLLISLARSPKLRGQKEDTPCLPAHT